MGKTRRMKLKPHLTHFAFAFLLGFSAFGQNKPILDPPELIAKREEHLRAMQRVALPELQAYAMKLNSLKQQFTREGKLEAGVAVDNELGEVNRQIQMAQDAGNATKAVAQAHLGLGGLWTCTEQEDGECRAYPEAGDERWAGDDQAQQCRA